MKPERWQQIDKLLEEALERDASDRAAFLDQACAGDEALRRKVEALLAAYEQAGDFLTRPALEVAARLRAEEQAQSNQAMGQAAEMFDALLPTRGPSSPESGSLPVSS